jgi:transposase-like protein
VSDTDKDVCGEPCKGGGACKNPATEADGSCWIKAHGPEGRGYEHTGRPSKLNPARQERIAEALEDGYSIKVAAVQAGIDEATYHLWRKKGRAAKEKGEDNQYVNFYERMERARAEGERRWTQRAYESAMEDKSFGAMMEILRKRYPDSWGSADHADDVQSLRVLLSDGRDEADREYATNPDEAEVE